MVKPKEGPGGHTWGDEVSDLMRGVTGAAIIGVPLLYTMEVWQGASALTSLNVVALLLLAVAVSTGYNALSGFRSDRGLIRSLMDGVEAVGIGLIFAALVLWLIGVIDLGTPPAEALRTVALEALPLSVGASIANGQFPAGETEGIAAEEGAKGLLRDAGITAAGAVVFAGSVAPTEEIVRIASRVGAAELIGLVVFSLLLSYGIIFVADFSGKDRRRQTPGLLQSPAGETLLAYNIALTIAFLAVVVFHGIRPGESPALTLAATVVMALPAAVGGAAGRLLV